MIGIYKNDFQVIDRGHERWTKKMKVIEWKGGTIRTGVEKLTLVAQGVRQISS